MADVVILCIAPFQNMVREKFSCKYCDFVQVWFSPLPDNFAEVLYNHMQTHEPDLDFTDFAVLLLLDLYLAKLRITT